MAAGHFKGYTDKGFEEHVLYMGALKEFFEEMNEIFFISWLVKSCFLESGLGFSAQHVSSHTIQAQVNDKYMLSVDPYLVETESY